MVDAFPEVFPNAIPIRPRDHVLLVYRIRIVLDDDNFQAIFPFDPQNFRFLIVFRQHFIDSR